MSEEDIYKTIEMARESGKISKGVNEVTRSIEKEEAKLVVVANDVTPKEIIMHIPLLCKVKNIPYSEVSSKKELGAACGLALGTATASVIVEGNSKKLISEIQKSQKKETKEEETEEIKETEKEEIKGEEPETKPEEEKTEKKSEKENKEGNKNKEE
ncbi:50S ribosomal protein L7ae [Candidatus Woesearchaeota archaeon]|nr:50S ribosomal protein L7ae [Candidatus Woesearchaeota archaeon]